MLLHEMEIILTELAQGPIPNGSNGSSGSLCQILEFECALAQVRE